MKKINKIVYVCLYLSFFILWWKNNPAEAERYIGMHSTLQYVETTEDINMAKKFDRIEDIYYYQNKFHRNFRRDYQTGFDMQQWYIREIQEQHAAEINPQSQKGPASVIDFRNTIGPQI